jgi:hypothetical protein
VKHLGRYFCLHLAIDADVTNLEYYMKRSEILEELGDKTKAIQGFRRLLSSKAVNCHFLIVNVIFVCTLTCYFKTRTLSYCVKEKKLMNRKANEM